MIVTSKLPIQTQKDFCSFFDLHLWPPDFEKGSATHGKRRYFAYSFQLADDTMQMVDHKTLYPFCNIKKMPYVMLRQ